MEKTRKKRPIWLIIIGALGGILLAPASGRETRQTIANDIEKGSSYLATLGHEAREEAGHIAESGKRFARKATHL
jgi:gas vesicle protein